MEREQMDQRSIKIEIPIPRLPRSPVVRFSLKTLALITSVIAIAITSYNLAREHERSRHMGGYLHIIVSSPFAMSAGSIPQNECSDLAALIRAAERRLHRQDHDPTFEEMWPPEVWINRADWEQPSLETRTDLECGGTYVAPKFGTDFALKQGDRVFVSFGKRISTNNRDVTSMAKTEITLIRHQHAIAEITMR